MVDINKVLEENQQMVDKAIEKFFPKKLTKEWIKENIGSSAWEYDLEALNGAITEPVWEFLERGGKRWRTLLMLLCCEAVGGNPRSTLPFVVVPELIHNGTLMVDDVEDGSELRRGLPCIHKIYGEDVAINTGNLLYFLPLLIVKNSSISNNKKVRIYELINKEMFLISLGQATDIYWHRGKKSDITESQYFQMCANKTGVLARLAAKFGAIMGDANDEQIEAFGRFAESIGVAFQIQDDILNIAPTEKWGKEFGDDISEGKRSLLIIHSLQVADEKDKKRLIEILDMHTKDKKLVEEAVNIMIRYDSVNYAKKKAGGLVEEAWQNINSVLEESDAKKKLRAFADFVIERDI